MPIRNHLRLTSFFWLNKYLWDLINQDETKVSKILRYVTADPQIELNAIHWNKKINTGNWLGNKKSRQYIASITGRSPDGWTINKSMKASPGSIGVLLNRYNPSKTQIEEIPIAGIKISNQYNRTRWRGGKTFLWLARQKKIEKLAVSSGLSFDNIIIKPLDEVCRV